MECARGREPITQNDIRYFRDRCQIGQELNCMVIKESDVTAHGSYEVPARCVVLHKGQHVAMTDIGTQQWALLAVWNKNKLREWKYLDQKSREIKGGYK